MNQDILKDLVTTSVSNDYDYDKVLAAFPELQGYDRQVLQDYVQTAVDSDFKYDKVNKAFPEFFPEYAKTKKEKTSKDDTTTESESTVSTSEDGSSGSNLSEEALAKIKELEEYEKENPHLKQIQDVNMQRQDASLPLLNDQDYEYSLNEKGEGQWTVPDASGTPVVVDDEMSKILEEKRVRDNEWAKKNMPVVDEDLISTDDGGFNFGFGVGSTGSLDMFNDRYSEYGFTFENPSRWNDSIKVTAKNGATMEFDVDNWGGKDERVAAEVNEFMQKNAVRFETAAQGQAANIKASNQQKSTNKQKSAQEIKEYTDLKEQVEIAESQEYVVSEEDKKEEYRVAEAKYRQSLRGYRPDVIEKKMSEPIAKAIVQKMANEALEEKSPEALRRKLEKLEKGQAGSANSSARINKAKTQYADELGLGGEQRQKFMDADINLESMKFLSGKNANGDVVSMQDLYDNISFKDEDIISQTNDIISVGKDQKTIQKNIRIATENFDGGWFAKSETQKKFEKEGKTALDDLDKDKKDAVVTLDLINKTIKEAKVEQDALGEKINAASIRKQIEAISSKEYSTQEEIDAANAKISKLKSEYESNVKQYNVYAADNKALFDSRNTAYRKIQNLNFTDEQLDQFTSVLGKNHQLGTQSANAAANATIDLVQGLEQFVYIVNPFGEASDWAVEEYGDAMPSAFKDFINVGKVVTGQALSVDWDNDPVTPTMRDSGKETMDFWQEDFSKRVQDPISFDDIENSSDAGEWFGVMLGGQVPTLTAMALTGGTAGLITMGATSAGQKFDALDKERNLYKQTGGEQGQDYGFGNMWLNSMLSGTAEALSEKITFGQMKYVKGALRGTVSTAREAGIQGFSKYMRQNLFNARNVKAFGKDLAEEGGSESVATIAGNIFDMASGKQGVNVFDDVAESFVSGIGISGSMKSPVLFKHMYRPFKSVSASDAMASNNSRLQDIKRRLHEEKNTLSKEETQDLQEEVGQLLHKNKELIEIDVNRVDALTDSDKSSLLKIDKNQTKLQQEFQRITNDKSIPDDVKQRDLDRLNQKYEKNLDSKNEIINKYPPTDVKKHQQNQQLLIEKTNNELKKMGSPLSIKVNEISDQQMKDNIADDEYGKQSKEVEEIIMEGSAVANAEIEAANKIINNPKSTAKQVKDAKENKKENEALIDNLSSAGNLLSGSAKTYGSMLPVFEGEGNNRKLTGFQIDINKSAALKNGKFSTRAHEFVHSVVYNTMNNNPAIRKALGDGVINMLNGDGMTFKPGKDALFNKRISGYAANMQGEEILTIASEMLADGDIEFNDTLLQKIKDFYRQFAQTYLGRDIEFNSNEDVRNFMKDLHVSIKNNKPNAAITKMMAKGAGGLMIDQATAPKKTITPEEASSQRVFSKAVDANLNSNPDLKSTFDRYTQNEDGSPKYKSQEDFEASPDYYDAYLEIVEGRSLDGLVQQGMTKKGLPPEALREFTRKAKEEIGKRFLPKIDKKTGEVKPESGYRVSNSSLFGWLTGVAGGAGMSIIYRAKGDVMVQYKKDKIAETTSLDKTVGDGAGRISDLMQGERDALLDRLDEEDLSIGRKDAAREVVNELKAREVFEFNKSTNDAIDSALDDADISIENLTYKGVKQFLSSAEKITREDKNGNVIVDKKTGNPKLFSPTKVSDVKPNGPLFKVLDAVSKHFGIDALRILANQDLDGPQRKSAQLIIFNSLIDVNGNLNQNLIGILAEGQTRSGEATGAANTKIGDLYAEGGRLKVAEGAKKSLGQKKAQDKRTDITKAEALELFNMNEAGTNLGGTKGDGAIRAFVVQMAQLEANQQLRIKSIQEGTSSDAARALLGDGKGLMAFSMDTEGLDDRIPQLIETVAISDMNPPTIAGIVADVYEGTDLKPSQVKKIEKNILAKVKDFKNKDESLKGRWSDISGKDVNEFFIDAFLAEDAKFNKGISKNLQNLIPLDENGKKIVIGNRAKSIDGGTKQRDFLVNATRDLKNEVGAKQAAETIVRQLMPMYAGMTKIGDGSIMPIEDGGELVINPRFEGGTNRQQSTSGKDDFIALVSKGLGPGVKITSPKQGTYMLIEADGSSIKLDVSMPTESTKAFFVESKTKSLADIFETRKKASLESRKEVKRLGDAAWARVQDPNDSFDAADFGLLIMSLGSSMNAPLRRAAYLSKIPQNFNEMAKKYGQEALGQIFQYEHAIPKEEIAGKIIQSYTTKGKLDESIFDGYEVNIIHKAMDKAIDDSGHKFTTRPDGNSRALNEDTALLLAKNASQADISELSPLMSIDPNNQGVEGDNFIKIVKALRNNKPYEISSLVGAVGRKRNWSKDTPSRGMSTFDFDETLIIDGDNFIIATDPATGNEIKISSGDWPIKGPELMQQGYDFNFDDFINVRGGVEGPLFQKFKNRITKYGPKNNYILTARPMEAAVAIHGWLKSKGINIPLENITGLGNSTGAAKAQWMLGKFEEGYNDMYFVDDALPNVEAVANVIDSLDIKGKSVQAERRFSSEAASELDNMLERSKGVDANEKFNRVKARNKGIKNRKRQIFIPPSAEDFQGLMYYNMGKGAQGDTDAGFFKKMFYDPFNKADRELDMYRQTLRQKATSISKALPNVRKKLRKDFAKTGYTVEQAMRIYLYDMNGHTVPGISKADQKKIASAVAVDSEMVLFANAIQDAVGIDGYLDPKAGWNAGSFNSDMADASKIKRTEFLQEWNENIDATFTEQALNKLEAIHGQAYRSALMDSIRRMKSGTNRPTIKDKKVNAFLDWTNGSVGAIMFFNARSAVLQMLSTVNFINFEDNNLFAAAKAFANQKQFWTDFKMLYNSPMLKQRRGGLQTDVSSEELSRAQEQGGTKAVIAKLLQVGFTPTQIADSFAISAGGASFYRNRVNKYLSEGLTQQEADSKAFEDFQEIAEQTQQSSRPDKISQEQASVLGRLILAFQNTPMQYNRLIKKAALDLINGRGSFKANVSRIIYYGAVQNLIFASLQNALFAAFGDDEEDEEFLDKKIERIANGTLDSLLRGSGIYGAIIAAAKNTVLKWQEERAKGVKQDNSKILVEAMNVSPPLGSKLRKINSALNTDKWNKQVYDKIPLSNIDNPLWDAIGSTVEGLTNVPLGRIQIKISNLKAASDDSNATWQRTALVLGWDKWGLGIDRPQEVEEAKQEAKEENRESKKQERKAREAEVKQEQEEKYLEKQKEEKKEDKKPRCAAATKSGDRCKGTPVDGTYCTIHARVEQRADGKDVQCKKIKSNGKRCGMQTSNKSGLCYYHD